MSDQFFSDRDLVNATCGNCEQVMGCPFKGHPKYPNTDEEGTIKQIRNIVEELGEDAYSAALKDYDELPPPVEDELKGLDELRELFYNAIGKDDPNLSEKDTRGELPDYETALKAILKHTSGACEYSLFTDEIDYIADMLALKIDRTTTKIKVAGYEYEVFELDNDIINRGDAKMYVSTQRPFTVFYRNKDGYVQRISKAHNKTIESRAIDRGWDRES